MKSGFLDMLVEDCRAAMRSPSATWSNIPFVWLRLPSFRIVVLLRMMSVLRRRGWRWIAGILHRRACRLGVDIHPDAVIGSGLCLPHPQGIVVGHTVRIGARVRLLHGVTLGGAAGKKRADGTSQPHVGNDVVIGAGAKVLGPVAIGDRVRIGANAVVMHDIPSGSVAVGIPARILRRDGQPVALLDRGGEISEQFREILARLDRIEAAIGRSQQL